ncbi:MAG: 16S rRNA (cytidine(1402)-2'-O)-methyltransferase [Hyphomicrobiales bacterium]|nr:16S rRNA (cytidine(1402)-2'-O)-methyltransferase [Hyphomicrobiales bacterium]
MSKETRPVEPGLATFVVEGVEVPAPAPDPGLYVVATPIGNLGDVTLRSLSILAAADLIVCEDTRVTRILLNRYGIRRPLLAYHEHNAATRRPRILSALADGQVVALVSDAGTPLISDPGYRLVSEAITAGAAVIPIPGASALLAGLVAAGLPTDTFFFAGFLPQKQAARRNRLAALMQIPGTLVFYESPRRIAATLADMAAVLGTTRQAAVARELTKIHEIIRRGSLEDLANALGAEPTPKGEIVILVGPPTVTAPDAEAVQDLLVGLLETESVRTAADEAAALTGLPRRDLYRRALALKGASGGKGD